MSGMERAAGWMDDPGRNSLGFSLDSFTVFSWQQFFIAWMSFQAGAVSMEMPGRALLHPKLRQEVLVERWPPTSSSKVYHEKLSPLPLSVSEKVAVTKVFVGPGLLPSECVSSTDQACLPRHPDALVIFLFFPVQEVWPKFLDIE